jgi:hypothetical protein
MKRWVLLGLLLFVSAPLSLLAGDVQVTCGSDLRVFLDGRYIGTSSTREGGLFLANVPDGTHVVRVEKDGYAPQTFQVEIGQLPTEVKVGAFSPQPAPGHEAERPPITPNGPVGNLVITSAPQNCTVEVDGKATTKDTPVLRFDGLTAGEHPISFSRPGFPLLSGTVRVAPGSDVTVRGDLMGAKIETAYEGRGSLVLTSFPSRCTVEFFGRTRETSHGFLKMLRVPAGEYRLVVQWGGRELATSVMILNGQRTRVAVSFAKGVRPFVITTEPE